MSDPVNHPSHYTSHPAHCACGASIQCIQITEHMSFNLGNAIKYIWRADLKGNAVQDLNKAVWYVTREIQKRRGVLMETEAPAVVGVKYYGSVADAVNRNADRDLAIAEAVRAACLNARFTITGDDGINLRSIIAGVK